MKIIKSIIFYPMLWMRGVFITFGKIVSSIMLLGFIASLFIKEWPLSITLTYLGFGLGVFILMQYYDRIFLKLNPNDSTLILEQ